MNRFPYKFIKDIFLLIGCLRFFFSIPPSIFLHTQLYTSFIHWLCIDSFVSFAISSKFFSLFYFSVSSVLPLFLTRRTLSFSRLPLYHFATHLLLHLRWYIDIYSLNMERTTFPIELSINDELFSPSNFA